MTQVGHYSIPPNISYDRETPDYVNNPLPTKINLVNLPDVISAVGTRIKEGQTIDPIVFEGIGEAINTARPEHGGLPLATFGDCYGEKIEQITKFFVRYITIKTLDYWLDATNGRRTDGEAHEERERLLSIAKTYVPELNGKLPTAQELVEKNITILGDRKIIF